MGPDLWLKFKKTTKHTNVFYMDISYIIKSMLYSFWTVNIILQETYLLFCFFFQFLYFIFYVSDFLSWSNMKSRRYKLCGFDKSNFLYTIITTKFDFPTDWVVGCMCNAQIISNYIKLLFSIELGKIGFGSASVQSDRISGWSG